MPPSLEALVRDVADADGGARRVRAAARLMTLLEAAPQRVPELLAHVERLEDTQPRLVLGLTGAPGSGKSTLTDQLVSHYREAFPDRRLGVLAVDPSSPFTGGAVLGDRVRMMRHATDPMVFIRSLATRGHLGGLSLGVKGVLRVMGLYGCDTVLIETVGVGQSEVEVAGVADVVLVILAPGQGDAVQMLKAGLMEIGDLFVVNKADTPGADQLQAALLSMLDLGRPLARHADLTSPDAPDGPPVFLVSATEGRGLPELVDYLEARAAGDAAAWQARREAAVLDEVREAVLEEARRRLGGLLNGSADAADLLRQVLDGRLTVSELTERLLRETTAAPRHP